MSDARAGATSSGPPAATTAPVLLNEEQRAAASAPLDQALVVLAAAGTGKTTTMRERVRYMLQQGVEAEVCLVLTFSRKAQAEFEQRLQSLPGAQGVTVLTFHSWAWLIVRRHWREAGFDQQPTILASEDQQLSLIRDCLVWDRLAELQACMRSWLFLQPLATWADVAEAAAERHAALYAAALQAALEAHNAAEEPGSWAALAPAAATACPFTELPPRLQMLLLLELHAALRRRFDSAAGVGSGSTAEDTEECGDVSAHDLLSSAGAQAPTFLSWLEAEKRRGHLPDTDSYAAYCAGACSSDSQSRMKRLLRVAAAYQGELRRLSLATLGDLPLLARRLLEHGGEALRWARQRWQHVLVDEFQDTGRCMLDLLKLLLGERRSITVVGDDDQSIYSFLSAVPRIFSEFQAHFGARMLCLQTNFRSTAAICSFGTALLHGIQGRAADKRMVPARTSSPCHPVAVRQFCSAAEEAEALACEVQRLWQQEGVPLSSMAALYRCLRLQGSAPHAPLMAALRRRSIPYVVVGHQRLAEDEGVSALMSYLALVANPACDPAFEAVLGLPWHCMGQDVRGVVAQQRHAARLAGRPQPSLLQCAEQVCSQAAAAQGAALPGGPQPFSSQLAGLVSELNLEDIAELQRLVWLLKQVQQSVGREPLPQAVRRVLHDSGLLAWLQQQQEEQGQGREEQGQQGEGHGQAGAEDDPLPPRLKTVLQKAQELAAEWQGSQAGEQAKAADVGSAGSSWLGDEEAPTSDPQQQQQQGVELVKELLLRLATNTSTDGGAPEPGSSTQEQEQPDGGCPGQLTISTIHASKGLEWPVVLLPSACDGHLPVQFRPGAAAAAAAATAAWQAGGRSGDDQGVDLRACQRAHYEEERRLFHVAATRARDRLLVSYVQLRPGTQQEEEAEAELDPGPASQPARHTQEQQVAVDPSQLPRCSSILAGTLRRLRRAAQQTQQGQQDLLSFEGRLPEEDWPGLWAPLAEEPAQESGSTRGALNSTGGNSQPRPLSLAEQCRQRLAAAKAGVKVGGVSKRPGGGPGARRRVVVARPAVASLGS